MEEGWGGSSAKAGFLGRIADAAAKCEIGIEAGCKIVGLRRTFEAGVCRGVKVAYDGDAHDRRLR